MFGLDCARFSSFFVLSLSHYIFSILSLLIESSIEYIIESIYYFKLIAKNCVVLNTTFSNILKFLIAFNGC